MSDLQLNIERSDSLTHLLNSDEMRQLGKLFPEQLKQTYQGHLQKVEEQLEALDQFSKLNDPSKPQNQAHLQRLIEEFVHSSTECYAAMEKLLLESDLKGKELSALQSAVKFYSSSYQLAQQMMNVLLQNINDTPKSHKAMPSLDDMPSAGAPLVETPSYELKG